MVKTRRELLREQMEEQAAEKKNIQEAKSEILALRKPEKSKPEGSMKTEPVPRIASSQKNSTSSSFAAQRRLLELKAKEEKAKIEMALIDARLAADIAELDESRSSRRAGSVSSIQTTNKRVKDWLEHSVAAEAAPEKEKKVISATFNKDKKVLKNNKNTYREHNSQPSGSGSIHGAGGDNQMEFTFAPRSNLEVDALKKSTVNPDVCFGELLSRLATSKDLPQYFGDPLEWMQFKRAYEESTAMCKYSDAENMWRLRKCLKGDAKEAVSSLMMGGVAPSIIIETLELQFGRPETVINKVVSLIKKMPPLPQAYHTQIVSFAIKIKNCATAARTMDPTYLNSPELVSTVVAKLPTALISKWTDYLFENKQKCMPKMELMSDFLYSEATKTATAGISHINIASTNNPENTYKRKFIPHHQALVVNAELKCKFCRKQEHPLAECKVFKRAMKRDRWRFVKGQRLCYQCLLPSHVKEECTGKPCDMCEMPHHYLLHWKKPTTDTDKPQPVSEHEESVTNTTTSNHPTVLLKMVHVDVTGPNGISIPTHVLLDDGATVTLISASLAERAGLHGKPQTLRINGALNNDEVTCHTEIVDFSITSSEGEKFNLRARKMKELQLPSQSYVDTSRFAHLRELKDCLLCGHSDIKPQLLIGQDNYHLLAPKEIIAGNKNQPYATHTPLGWCVHGTVCTSAHDIIKTQKSDRAQSAPDTYNNNSAADLMLISASDESLSAEKQDTLLHEKVRRYFEFESIGVSMKPRENKLDQQAVTILNNTIKLLDNKQWEVGLPWKDEHMEFQESFNCAAKRLKNVEKKMTMDKEYAERYRDRVKHLFENDYARKVTEDESSTREWFLPHFGVDNPKKKKLRLVFDAAAKSHGHSLNSYLLQGPDLLQSLLGVMLRFRERPVGVAGDIKDMFLRIKIRPEDQHALQFLWRDLDSTQPLKTSKYAMTSLIFGANCSPFVAQFVKNTNAKRFAEEMPEAVEAVLKSHYMDDYIQSHDDEETAAKMIHDITYIHKQGGFDIRNWVSNNKNVLMTLPQTTLSTNTEWSNPENRAERTLGMLWYPSSDTFGFDLSLEKVPKDILDMTKHPTKREVLRITMSIFDVYGLLAPFIVTAKIILQEIWKTSIGWDEDIPITLFTSFKEWIAQLKNIGDIRIPRWYFHSGLEGLKWNKNMKLELHVFCDASPSAYAAVAYWRLIRDNGTCCVAFIASKCRVSPVRPTSVPRLELQAALLGSRLANTIELEHTLKATEKFYWTDSTTVLHWIKNECRTYKTFIANRLGEIDTLSRTKEWHYVPTSMNVADAATKKNNYDLHNDCEWFHGPTFLHGDPKNWPTNREPETKIDETVLEKINIVQINNECNLPTPQPDRFSSWMRLLRATATMLLFIRICKKIEPHSFDCTLMRQAETLLIRKVQSDSYRSEIADLKENRQINKSSKLHTLTPYLDSQGLLRVGGRINAAPDVTKKAKSPVILDGQHHITRLIVKHHHESAAHANNETVVNTLRQTYWVTRLRPTVRTVAARCQVCRIRKAKPSPPRLGDLPEARMTHHQRPFTCTGLDLFGPVDITVGRRHEKRYGVLFTCLTVRAVHIELVPTLTTDSLIMALRRMAARRGWPKHLYSDNGTNLRGADAEIKKCQREIDESVLKEYGVNNDMEWHFIPPLSPNMAGAWERLIRSVKTALKVVLKKRAPREEVLTTLLAEVENLINSRPLTHVSVDPTSDEALTPNHFLLGSSSTLPTLGAFDDADLYLRKHWRKAQRLTDMFWQRWLKEVLPALLPRQKWTQEGHQYKNGDLVFIVDPNGPRNTWPRGRVVNTYPGHDGRVRVVEVRTKMGIMKRPATRLAPLPTTDECCRSSTRVENVGDTTKSAT